MQAHYPASIIGSVTREISLPPADLLERWQKWYPDAPAIAFLVREAYPERWLRIHSLPESKRYPESDAEYRELLTRHNTVASYVLGLGAECAVMIYSGCEDRWTRDLGLMSTLSDGPLPTIGRLPEELWDEDQGCFVGPMCLSGAALTWRPGVLDGFIAAVAQNRIGGLVVDLATGAVYAPYDGGADLFFQSGTERDIARERFSSWLSAHPEGL